MAGTRSSVKRKSICSSPAAPSSPPEPPSSSAPKRQKLPLRKKASRSFPGEDAQDRLDLDAALQAEVAAGTPDTPLPTRVVSAAPAAAAAAAKDDEDDEGSDSDEAPEEVSNVQAGTRAKAAVEAMKKAAKEETERIRQKRKERDARLKDQARARKPKPEAEAPEAEAKAESDADAEEKADESPVTATATAADARKPSRGKIEIPTLLPEEFLSSDSEDDGDDDDAGRPSKRRKGGVGARKREPRDKRVGGTVFRVVKQVDARMAPRGEGRTKSVRTALLKRGREEGARRAGFLVGGRKRADWGTSRR